MLRLDAYMARSNAAYYATRNPYADFTTAPEISQMFGEILGLWSAMVWRSMGSPDPMILAEAGPGRGTLMADALRAIGMAAPEFRAAVRVHLVETSQALRAVQAQRLEAVWHDHIDDLPAGPMILLANEFLDALPIRQFVRRTTWCERFVREGGFVELPCDEDLPDEPEGTVIERCEPALALAASLAARLRHKGGAALFIDYGPAESTVGDSLQALLDGRTVDPLQHPGEADLTAHVDFAAFAAAAEGCACHGPVPQGLFLARLGLHQRADRLARGQPPAVAARLIADAQRLAAPQWMGRLFKALAICHPDCALPPGFAA